eukprot:2070603-Heterocapsa_arctica.AAC.1
MIIQRANERWHKCPVHRSREREKPKETTMNRRARSAWPAGRCRSTRSRRFQNKQLPRHHRVIQEGAER